MLMGERSVILLMLLKSLEMDYSKNKVISSWFPEYKNFNFLNKLDLGISSFGKPFFLALCQMMLVKRNLRIIWTEQKEENLFLFCLFG